MLWLKAFHVIFMVAWFAGLFYLPRLFVYHSSCEDQATKELFKIMGHKLYYYIMMPAFVITATLGLSIMWIYGVDTVLSMHWLLVKLVFVAFLIGFHF
ncbi:MAG: CopD family protein, partial [Gammaproteobacteria bacterium]|nr:CopD family protein [Gammaproteobacteria bacterium]